MANNQSEGRKKREELIKQSKKSKGFAGRHRKLIIVLVILVILILAFLFLLTRSKPEPDYGVDFNVSLEDEDEYDLDGLEDTYANADPIAELEGLGGNATSDAGYKHYLLLGVDGVESGFKGKRSDAIMIVSVNSKEDCVVITSIPRDTYVYIEGKGYDKITHAYAYGQAKLTVETIQNNFDIQIENYFTINFEGMEELVDLVGGVTITLTQAESDNIRDFFGVPGTTAGTQILNGQQALAYCRVRMIDSDFKRTQRQFNVLAALYEEAKTTPVRNYPSLLTTIYEYLYTDASLAECISLGTSIMSMDFGSMENVLLFSDSNGTGKKINGVYYLVPNDLEGTIVEWRESLGITDYEPSDSLKTYSDYLKTR